MYSNYVMIDNKRIDLSDETVGNLRKQLGIPKPKQVKVYRFRAAKINTAHFPYPYLLGGVSYSLFTWDGLAQDCPEAQIGGYTKKEVQQIIASLQDLIKD